MNPDAIKGSMGLAMRAGLMVTGVDMAVSAIRAGTIGAAFLDEAAAKNTVKRMEDTCSFYKVPLFRLPEGFMDAAMGKEGRMAAAVKKGKLAQKMLSTLSSVQADA